MRAQQGVVRKPAWSVVDSRNRLTPGDRPRSRGADYARGDAPTRCAQEVVVAGMVAHLRVT